MSRIP